MKEFLESLEEWHNIINEQLQDVVKVMCAFGGRTPPKYAYSHFTIHGAGIYAIYIGSDYEGMATDVFTVPIEYVLMDLDQLIKVMKESK